VKTPPRAAAGCAMESVHVLRDQCERSEPSCSSSCAQSVMAGIGFHCTQLQASLM